MFGKELKSSFTFKQARSFELLQPQRLHDIDYPLMFSKDKSNEISLLVQLAQDKYAEAMKNKTGRKVPVKLKNEQEDSKTISEDSIKIVGEHNDKPKVVSNKPEVKKTKNVPKRYSIYENYKVPLDMLVYHGNNLKNKENSTTKQIHTQTEQVPSYFENEKVLTKVPTNGLMQKSNLSTFKRYHILTHIRPSATMNSNYNTNTKTLLGENSSRYEIINSTALKNTLKLHTTKGVLLDNFQVNKNQASFLSGDSKSSDKASKNPYCDNSGDSNCKLQRIIPKEPESKEYEEEFKGICNKIGETYYKNKECPNNCVDEMPNRLPKLIRLVKRNIINLDDSSFNIKKCPVKCDTERADDKLEPRKKTLQKLKPLKVICSEDPSLKESSPLPRLKKRFEYPQKIDCKYIDECEYYHSADELCNYEAKPKILKPLLPCKKKNEKYSVKPFGEIRRLTLIALDTDTRKFLEISKTPFTSRKGFHTSTVSKQEIDFEGDKRRKVECPKFENCKCPPKSRDSCKPVPITKDCTKQNSPYKSFSELKCLDEIPNMTECSQLPYLQPRIPILGTIQISPPPPPKHANIDPKIEEDCVLQKLCHEPLNRSTDCDNREARPFLRQRDFNEFTTRVKCELLPDSAKPFKKNISKKSFHNSSITKNKTKTKEKIKEISSSKGKAISKASNNLSEELANSILDKKQTEERRVNTSENKAGIASASDEATISKDVCRSIKNIECGDENVKKINGETKVGALSSKEKDDSKCNLQSSDDKILKIIKDSDKESLIKCAVEDIILEKGSESSNVKEASLSEISSCDKSNNTTEMKISNNKEKSLVVLKEECKEIMDGKKETKEIESSQLYNGMFWKNSYDKQKMVVHMTDTPNAIQVQNKKDADCNNKSLWIRFIEYFKARPGCPEPGDWKKEKMQKKALKTVKAITNKPNDNITKCTSSSMNSVKRQYSSDSKNKGKNNSDIKNKCEQEMIKKGFVGVDKSCSGKAVPSCGVVDLKSSCSLPMNTDCKRTRTTCKVTKIEDCCYIEAPFPSFTDIHPPFPPIKINECTETERRTFEASRKPVKKDSGKRRYGTLVTPRRNYSSYNGNLDYIFPNSMFNSESKFDEFDQQELAIKMLDVLKEYIEKSHSDANNKLPIICNAANLNLCGSDTPANEMEEKLIEAIKIFCRKAPLFYNVSQLEEIEKNKTKELEDMLNELMKKYE